MKVAQRPAAVNYVPPIRNAFIHSSHPLAPVSPVFATLTKTTLGTPSDVQKATMWRTPLGSLRVWLGISPWFSILTKKTGYPPAARQTQTIRSNSSGPLHYGPLRRKIVSGPSSALETSPLSSVS